MMKKRIGEIIPDSGSGDVVISLPLNLLMEASRYAVNLPNASEGAAAPEVFSVAAIGRNEQLPCTLKGARGRRPELHLVLPDG